LGLKIKASANIKLSISKSLPLQIEIY